VRIDRTHSERTERQLNLNEESTNNLNAVYSARCHAVNRLTSSREQSDSHRHVCQQRRKTQQKRTQNGIDSFQTKCLCDCKRGQKSCDIGFRSSKQTLSGDDPAGARTRTAHERRAQDAEATREVSLSVHLRVPLGVHPTHPQRRLLSSCSRSGSRRAFLRRWWPVRAEHSHRRNRSTQPCQS